MRFWKKKSPQEIKEKVFKALNQNVDFYEQDILGVPASHLDTKVFNKNEEYLKDKPYLSALVNNPNHIGCHTLGLSENFFTGTQQIERDLIDICAYDILKGDKVNSFDGYVASGGTEANMQAIWAYRNYYMQEHKATLEQIAIISSTDTHYSVAKASNVFGITNIGVEIEESTRQITTNNLNKAVNEAQENGVKYFIVFANMMTTMFGSVDNITCYTDYFTAKNINFKLHVDGAYGGFFYPFSVPKHNLDFSNKHVSSVTLDAHKMAQAPYGTGIIVLRKGLINFTNTSAAKYVAGEDYTLVGSRSGANAVAIWMILVSYGAHAWFEKILVLRERTKWLTKTLSNLNITYFNQEGANIVTIKATDIQADIAKKYMLVPDNHNLPTWYKIVVMEHVTIEVLEKFIAAVKKSRRTSELNSAVI